MKANDVVNATLASLQREISGKLVLSALREIAAADQHATLYAEARLECEHADLAARNNLRFLGNVTHELRTPLNAIMGYVELMRDEIHGPVTDAQLDDLNRIQLNQTHLLSLINDLLAFVQVGTARGNRIVELSAKRAVARAVALIENTFRRKSLTYLHQSNEPDLIVLGDEERIGQILLNLLANAVKFTPRGGRISAEIDGSLDEVRISVADTGIGIAPEKLEMIFEPFVQVNELEAVEGGVGLGLAISRDLARSMNGDILVESARGSGTRFTLVLPRAPARPTSFADR